MKTLVSRVVVVMVVALCAVAAYGQSSMNLRGEIPFEFTVGKQVLSSGNYTITNLMGFVDCMRSEDGKPVAFNTMLLSDKNEGQPRLVFHRYSDETILVEVWTPTAGYKLSGSTDRAKKLAKAGSYETIAMLLEPAR